MSRHRLCLVAAASSNGVIGRDNTLPWRLPADLRHFRALTMGKPVLMGRRTWASIGRPLPGRDNIVLSRDPDFRAEGAAVVHSFDAARALALDLLPQDSANEVMVIGGGALYAEALPLADRIYLTRVHAELEGDTFFPAVDGGGWLESASEHWPADAENVHAMTFVQLDRHAADGH